VIWGDPIYYKPPNMKGDTTYHITRFYPAANPDLGCDTLRTLHITIIDERKLTINFSQDEFCKGDDMKGDIKLETNFTAFDWLYKDKDSTFTIYEKSFSISEPGYYYVKAYMDTSLYDTLTNLRIVCCSETADILVEDCPLIIPNVITPNGDKVNDWLGIKKLNLQRDNELIIYDRWGKNVFQQKNYRCLFKENKYYNVEEAFAGLSRGGQPLPEGTYYYVFKYHAIPKKKTYTGIFTILRDNK